MTLADLIINILRDKPEGMTPQEIRDVIKVEHPEFYGTPSHQRNVEKGHYNSLDHAMLAQIYVASKGGKFQIDRTSKPFRMMLGEMDQSDLDAPTEDIIDTENLDRLEAGIGSLYVLGTHLFTREGREIIKIGVTTGEIDRRITQLYTTGVPFRFRIIKVIETKNYNELELSLHKLLDPYRINRSREFFLDTCLKFVDRVAELHRQILENAEQAVSGNAEPTT